MYVSIPGKLTEIHLHAWLFSNSCGKVIIIFGISWSPDLRVQHILLIKRLYLTLMVFLPSSYFNLNLFFQGHSIFNIY